ncbi:hypothetical protein AB0C10_15850 [Microbispora amethystogenes]|uniref:hypothetical protein n=1 Tax=Microbispora amethystogenes TaxID=1427754 RepID=UPI0033EC0CE2
MTNRILGQLSYTGSTTSSFTVPFDSAPAAGSRVIVVVEPGNPISTRTSGYTLDVSAQATEDIWIFSKIATGSESGFSFTVSGGNVSSVFATAYERDDCPDLLFTGSDVWSSATASATVEVPAGVVSGFVVAALTAGNRNSADPNWNQSLALDAGLSGSNNPSLKVFFASGSTIPPAGEATYTATGQSSGGLGQAFAVAAYGRIVTDVPVTASDSATLTEGRSVAVALARSDTGTLTETALVEPGTTAADSALLAETSTLEVVTSDSGALVEHAAVAGEFLAADEGSLADAAQVDEHPGPVTGDRATVAETATVAAGLAAADAGALTETARIDALWVLDGRWSAGLPYVEWAASTPYVEWAASPPYL